MCLKSNNFFVIYLVLKNGLRGMPVIAVNNLTKYYGKVVGIRDISFAVEKGEIFGFLGPNGAGKTTTIRLLLDLIRPTSGEIRIFGVPLRANSIATRARCGYLPGTFSAYQQMTGMEFLKFMSHFRRKSFSPRDELLERFDLSEKELSRKIKHLSHGMLQKIGLVQAFFHRPELLILDEPTSGLDPLMQQRLYDLLGEYQSRGTTVFFSSHNLPEVEKVCTRVAIVREGSLVALDKLDDLRKKRYRRLQITLHQPVEKIELPGAELIRQKGLQYEFLFRGATEQLLKRLVQLPIEDLLFPEASLEELFMTYYRGNEND